MSHVGGARRSYRLIFELHWWILLVVGGLHPVQPAIFRTAEITFSVPVSGERT